MIVVVIAIDGETRKREIIALYSRDTWFCRGFGEKKLAICAVGGYVATFEKLKSLRLNKLWRVRCGFTQNIIKRR